MLKTTLCKEANKRLKHKIIEKKKERKRKQVSQFTSY